MVQAMVALPFNNVGWRPGNVASRIIREVAHNHDLVTGYMFAYYTPVRFL